MMTLTWEYKQNYDGNINNKNNNMNTIDSIPHASQLFLRSIHGSRGVQLQDRLRRLERPDSTAKMYQDPLSTSKTWCKSTKTGVRHHFCGYLPQGLESRYMMLKMSREGTSKMIADSFFSWHILRKNPVSGELQKSSHDRNRAVKTWFFPMKLPSRGDLVNIQGARINRQQSPKSSWPGSSSKLIAAAASWKCPRRCKRSPSFLVGSI